MSHYINCGCGEPVNVDFVFCEICEEDNRKAANNSRKEFLEKIRHALVVSHNLTATDKPDIANIPEDISFVIDNNKEIAAIDEVLKPLL